MKKSKKATETENFNSEALSNEPSLGEILREKRCGLKMEIAEISSYLKIKKSDIEAIEEGNLAKITKHLYIPGLIKSYGKFLKIDDKIIEKKIKNLEVKSNSDGKKHKLINIGENLDLTPNKEFFLNSLVISAFLLLTMFLWYNSSQNKDDLIPNRELIHELQNLNLND